MLELQRNVPMPPKRQPRYGVDGRKKYPIERMAVGDFFFVPGKRYSSIRTYFIALGKQHNVKLKAEQTYGRQVKDRWEHCEQSEPGAIYGVGVWRTE